MIPTVVRRLGTALVVLVAAVSLVGMLAVASEILRTGRTDTRAQADAVVVLGASQRAGWPRPVLQARLDHARGLYEAGYAATIVTTGGFGGDRTASEAAAGAAWLTAAGVPESDIVVVPEGEDTVSSLAAVRDAELAAGWSSVLLVTDPQHTYRSVAMAEHVGLDVVGASPTGSGPNAAGSPSRFGFFVLRETLAYLSWRGELVAAAATDAAGK